MKFRFDNDGNLIGPKDYFEARGHDLFNKIADGNDEQFGSFARHAPDIKTAICVRLQTDYAAWRGEQQLMQWG